MESKAREVNGENCSFFFLFLLSFLDITIRNRLRCMDRNITHLTTETNAVLLRSYPFSHFPVFQTVCYFFLGILV